MLYITSHKWSTTRRVLKSHKSKMGVSIYVCNVYIYAIMKAMCPLSYHHKGFVVTQRVLNKLSKERNRRSVTIHQVPKCISWHKAIVVITGRAHCFHDCIHITPILLLWDLTTLCVVDHLWPFILRSLLSLLKTLWFIGTSTV